jgi:predicted metal-dependent hydrolase
VATKPAVPEEPVLVHLAGGALPYTLRRSPRAYRIRVVVDPARGAIVTVPGGRRLGAGEGRRLAATFVAERETWIRGHLAKQAERAARLEELGPIAAGSRVPLYGREHRLVFVPARAGARRSTVLHDAGATELIVRLAARDTRSAADVLRDYCRDLARPVIEAALMAHGAGLGVSPTAVSIRDQRTRWGSASRTGRLSFSWRLILAPPEALDTVVIHELAHLRVFGHGPRFWAVVASRRPDHRLWQRWLRDHAFELHALFDDPPVQGIEEAP